MPCEVGKLLIGVDKHKGAITCQLLKAVEMLCIPAFGLQQ